MNGLLLPIAFFLCLPVASHAQVVFSRRVYTPTGQTYQQIWSWNTSTGRMVQLTRSERPHFRPQCSGKDVVRFVSGADVYTTGSLWSFNRDSGQEQEISDKAETEPANAHMPDAATKKLIATFSQRTTPALFAGWSSSRRYLLITTQGESDNSTSRQSDFFILDVAHSKWMKAGSGNDPVWIPGKEEIVYSTPRDLSPQGKRNVWTAQLQRFDPAGQKTIPVTSGVTHNVHPAACVSSTSRGSI